jgi:8-oxo-dGTP pyrophosphatase MutT (NUDIX family)
MLEQQVSNYQPYGNAGCIVKRNEHILVVKLRETGKWDIPAGKPLPNEAAPQTAERETWEETGVKVKVKRLLTFIDAPKEGNLYIYEAVPLEKVLPLNMPLHIHDDFTQEIIEARFLPITNLNKDNFRYPAMLSKLLALFYSIS